MNDERGGGGGGGGLEEENEINVHDVHQHQAPAFHLSCFFCQQRSLRN